MNARKRARHSRRSNRRPQQRAEAIHENSRMAKHPLVKFSFQENARAKEMMAVVTGVTLQFLL
jgi:hypothetical protein